MKTTIEATRYFLARRARMTVLKKLAQYWRFWNSPLLPESYLVELYPELKSIELKVTANVKHPFELPYGERLVLAGLLEQLKPGKIFEFGTFTGSTTTLIADLSPEASQIYTLDLPDDALIEAGIDPKEIGSWFNGNPAYEGKINQLKGFSREFDFSEFEGEMDLIFVDGSHEYDDVLSDSRNALRMLAPGGIILWDDYHPPCLPVAAAIDDLAKEVSIKRIAQTRLAIYGPHQA